MTPQLRKSACAAALGCLLATASASAHTIDVRGAAAAVRAQAQSLGQVDRAKCWRPVVYGRRDRHRAICVAWWVHTAHGPCAVFYRVRLAANPRGRMVVIQTFQPWCN